MSVAIDVTRRPLSTDALVALDWRLQRMTKGERSALDARLIGCARGLADAGLSPLDALDEAFDRVVLPVLVS